MIQPAGSEPRALSFINLVELHVMAALRRHHRVPMQRIRVAIQYLERQLRLEHPLARRELLTDGFSVFIEHLDRLLNLSARGQLEMREIVYAYLQRVEHDDELGLAARLFPFTRGDRHQSPTLIVIDPSISFGRPVVMGSGVRADVIVNFFNTGETIADLADEYQLHPFQIEEAVRYALAA
ncbi:MAG: DUF433 domain-containing protein [Chloroflexi bacterium]|nr:DUF433 domain-containing protein [Chloroflexota bacterium]